jgi:hypothetical protein
VNREVPGSSGGLYTLQEVWQRPPANNLPQTSHSVGAYDTMYVFLFNPKAAKYFLHMENLEVKISLAAIAKEVKVM